MRKLIVIPNGLKEINEIYGNPDIDNNGMLDAWFVESRLGVFISPFPMRLSWKPNIKITKFQAHIDIGNVIVDALEEIMNYKGYEYLEENSYDLFGGVFNFRPKRGGNGLSVHSWGIAIDINPHIAPYGKTGHQPQFIINAFMKRGFEWGGSWEYPDPMHFQACKGY